MTLYKLERDGRYVAYFTNEKVARKVTVGAKCKVTPVAANYNDSNNTYSVDGRIVKSRYVVDSDSVRQGRIMMSASTIPIKNLKSLSEFFSARANAISRSKNRTMQDIADKIGGVVKVFGHGGLCVEMCNGDKKVRVTSNTADETWTISRSNYIGEDQFTNYETIVCKEICELYEGLGIEFDGEIPMQMDISILEEFGV